MPGKHFVGKRISAQKAKDEPLLLKIGPQPTLSDKTLLAGEKSRHPLVCNFRQGFDSDNF
jgi:hypothetical protein